MAEPPGGEQVEHARIRRRRLARATALAVVVVAAVSFVVENAQPVKVRFWLVTSHPRLIWVVVVCLAAGALLGYDVGRTRRRRTGRRKGRRDT